MRTSVSCSTLHLSRLELTRTSISGKTFGVPIISHQAVAFMLADMAIGVESSRYAFS